jgi:hypothetical protein
MEVTGLLTPKLSIDDLQEGEPCSCCCARRLTSDCAAAAAAARQPLPPPLPRALLLPPSRLLRRPAVERLLFCRRSTCSTHHPQQSAQGLCVHRHTSARSWRHACMQARGSPSSNPRQAWIHSQRLAAGCVLGRHPLTTDTLGKEKSKDSVLFCAVGSLTCRLLKLALCRRLLALTRPPPLLLLALLAPFPPAPPIGRPSNDSWLLLLLGCMRRRCCLADAAAAAAAAAAASGCSDSCCPGLPNTPAVAGDSEPRGLPHLCEWVAGSNRAWLVSCVPYLTHKPTVYTHRQVPHCVTHL